MDRIQRPKEPNRRYISSQKTSWIRKKSNYNHIVAELATPPDAFVWVLARRGQWNWRFSPLKISIMCRTIDFKALDQHTINGARRLLSRLIGKQKGFMKGDSVSHSIMAMITTILFSSSWESIVRFFFLILKSKFWKISKFSYKILSLI